MVIDFYCIYWACCWLDTFAALLLGIHLIFLKCASTQIILDRGSSINAQWICFHNPQCKLFNNPANKKPSVIQSTQWTFVLLETISMIKFLVKEVKYNPPSIGWLNGILKILIIIWSKKKVKVKPVELEMWRHEIWK